MSEIPTVDGMETLKLTEWEVGNLHLPPVTTVTLYEGSASVGFLRSRIESMLEKNPWLTSRIVKKNTTDGVVAMTYTRGFDARSAVEQHFTVYKPGEVGLSLDMPCFPGDMETPALIRRSIRGADGAFRARRAGRPETGIPGLRKLLRNRISIISNWASFYGDVDLQDTNGTTLNPKLHFPIMEPDGMITSIWNNAIIFRPRAGDLAMLMITRRFDNETLARRKVQDGPLGKRIL